MQIVNASSEVIEKIKQMLIDSGSDERNLRIVGSLGFGDIPEGFKLFPGEATPKDHIQKIDGLTFIVADILAKLYRNFTITYEERFGVMDLNITAEKKSKSSGQGCTSCASCG